MCIHSSILAPETCSICKGFIAHTEPGTGHDTHGDLTRLSRPPKQNTGVDRTGPEELRLSHGLELLGEN